MEPIIEYLARNKKFRGTSSDATPQVPDTFCFFKKENELFVVTCNYQPRALSHCHQCSPHKHFIEVLTINKDSVVVVSHIHEENPNMSLEDILFKYSNSVYKPIIIENEIDIEKIIFKEMFPEVPQEKYEEYLLSKSLKIKDEEIKNRLVLFMQLVATFKYHRHYLLKI
jgi:hypothetical protein